MARPVAYMHSHAKHGDELSFMALTAADKKYGWTETPLYALDRGLKPLVETGTGSIACDESPGSASAEIAHPSPPTGDDNV